MPEADIAGYGSALPYAMTTERFLEVDREARRALGQDDHVSDLMRKIALNSRVSKRHVVSPCWLPEDERPAGVEDIFTPNRFDPPGNLRARFWKEQAPARALRAAQDAIVNWGGAVSEITSDHDLHERLVGARHLGRVIHELGLSLDTQKQELNFNGCFCGATCLRLARDIVRAGDAKAVLVVAVETASVQYDPVATDMSSLIASSLFADGAGVFILAPEGPWAYRASGMSLVPDTQEALRMSPDLESDRSTYRMFLHREIGSRLATYFRDERGGELLDSMLDFTGEPPALAVHPGGPAILESVSSEFEARGWPKGAMDPSMATLYDTGNLGAAAMLFVLARLLPQVEADHVRDLRLSAPA